MSTSPAAARSHARSRPQSEPGPLVGLVRSAWSDLARRPTLLGFFAAVGLLVAMFGSNLAHMVFVWSSDENYGHGFLVPLIALYFANEATRGGEFAYRPGTGVGVILLFGAILGRLATVVVPVGFVADLAMLAGLAGIVAIVFGGGALRRYGFAIGFLAFMVPLPIALYARIASPLQLSVSSMAAWLLNVVGVPALCEGNMITLPGDARLFVAEACSGMRQLTGFLALTTAWAYLVRRPIWYRVTLVAGSVPIAMAANVSRVAITGWITYRLDARYASGSFHTIEGLLMIGLGLVLLRAMCWTLDRIPGVLPPRLTLGTTTDSAETLS